MYCVYGESRSSLLIESTDSVTEFMDATYVGVHVEVLKKIVLYKSAYFICIGTKLS